MKDFINFIRKQGVIGLAVGFLLGGAVSKLVSAIIQDIINPVLGVVLGAAAGLQNAVLKVGPIEILWGHFLGVLIDFLVVTLVIYWGVKTLGIEKLDKKE